MIKCPIKEYQEILQQIELEVSKEMDINDKRIEELLIKIRLAEELIKNQPKS